MLPLGGSHEGKEAHVLRNSLGMRLLGAAREGGFGGQRGKEVVGGSEGRCVHF